MWSRGQQGGVVPYSRLDVTAPVLGRLSIHPYFTCPLATTFTYTSNHHFSEQGPHLIPWLLVTVWSMLHGDSTPVAHIGNPRDRYEGHLRMLLLSNYHKMPKEMHN